MDSSSVDNSNYIDYRMLKRVVSSPLIQTRNVRKKRTPQPQWLEDATTFKDTHTVLTDAHSTLPYPTDVSKTNIDSIIYIFIATP